MSMKVSGTLVAGAIVLVGLSSLSTTAKAAENIDVTATVAGACTLTAVALNFGTYVAGQSNAKNEDTTVSYDCASGLDVTLTLSAGSSGNENARTMSSVTAFDAIGYQLYQNSGRATVWGTGANGVNVNPTLGGGAQNLTVFGQIPGNLNPTPANDYTDVVVFDLAVN